MELAAISAVATLASGALTAVGTIAAGNAAREQGKLQNQMSQFEAKQMEIKANDEFAAGQQQSGQLNRQKKLALSTLQNRAAGSGFSATDPSTLAIADEIETYGTLQEQMALYGGGRAQADLRTGAGARRYEGAIADSMGKFKQTQSYLSAAGTIMGSIANATSMSSKYGQKSAPAPTGRYG